jgi:hypothetical protein
MSASALSPHPLLADRESALTLAEAADYFGIAPATLRNWISVGVRGHVLPTFVVGWRRYVRPADAARFLESIQEEARRV